MINTYEAIESTAIPLLPVYFIIAFFSSIITGLMFKKWQERKGKPALLLFITFLIYTIAIIVLTIGFSEAVITGEKRELYKFSLAFGYFMVMIANCSLIVFAMDIFSIPKKNGSIYLILCVIVAILVVLPQNYYGVPDVEAGSDNIRIYSTIAMMIVSILTYSRIYQKAITVSTSVQDNTAKVGFRYIGYSQFGMIAFFLFQLIDTLIFTIFDTPGYSIFVYFAWFSAGIFMFLAYGGLIMPEWLKKRYNLTK
jgi:hypothetical protein